MINPATIKALAEGDIENAIVASTPGGIERQEAAGQQAFVASASMPKEMRPSREAFESLGFKFGEDIDDLFVEAALPEGWSKSATSHSMHSDIVDSLGRKRVGVFYKAAFYDRNADAYLISRYQVAQVYPSRKDAAIGDDTLIPTVITDAGVEIHRVGESKYLNDWENEDILRKEARAWLDSNRPGLDDPVKSWSVE